MFRNYFLIITLFYSSSLFNQTQEIQYDSIIEHLKQQAFSHPEVAKKNVNETYQSWGKNAPLKYLIALKTTQSVLKFSVSKDPEAIQLVYESHKLLEDIKTPEDSLYAIRHIMWGYTSNHALNISLSLHNVYYKLCVEQQNLEALHKTYGYLAFKLIQEMRPNEAIDLLNKCIPLLKKNNQKTFLSQAYNNIGLAFLNKTLYKDAFISFKKSEAICIENNDSIGLGDIYTNIGLILSKQGKHKEALKYQNKVMEIAKATNNSYFKETAHINRGVEYGHLFNESVRNDSNKVNLSYALLAAEEYHYAAQSASTSNNTTGEIIARSNIGSILLDVATVLKDKPKSFLNNQDSPLTSNFQLLLDSAKNSSKTAFQLSQDFNSTHTMSYILNNFALVSFLKEDFRTAISQYKQLADFTLSRKEFSLYKDACLKIAESEEKLGNHQEALRFHKIYVNYLDTLFQTEKATRIGELQASFDYEKQLLEKEKTVLVVTQQKRNRNIILVFTTAAIMVVLIFLYLLKKDLKSPKGKTVLLKIKNYK